MGQNFQYTMGRVGGGARRQGQIRQGLCGQNSTSDDNGGQGVKLGFDWLGVGVARERCSGSIVEATS
jgi:hypothetical protein